MTQIVFVIQRPRVLCQTERADRINTRNVEHADLR